MEPIDTEFRGDLFRSRTEARWAVFFSELEEPYVYEPEGYDLNGTRYLPDFWLPDLEIWVEIKPDREYSLKELRKAQLLSEESRKMVAVVRGRPHVNLEETSPKLKFEGIRKAYSEEYLVDLFIGPVWNRISNDRIETLFDEEQWEWIAGKIREAFRRRDVRFDGTEESVRQIRELFPDFVEYRGHDRSEWKRKWLERKRVDGYRWCSDEDGLTLSYSGGGHVVNDETRPVVNALRAANQARFEHGEGGKPSDFSPV